jgi:hypothetical protein
MANGCPAAVSAVTALVAVVLLAQAPALGQAPSVATKAKTRATRKIGTVSRTPDGQPDLQGIWSYATLTPLERPRELAGKEFFTEKEVADYEKSLLDKNNRDRRDGGAEADLARSYNVAWSDSGTHIVKTRRTSLIIDPPDGRMPAFTPETQKREAARAEDRRRRGGDPADSWEDRSLGERCLTRGAPKLPSVDNNNIQIVQAPGYVAILQEMIHEARIIPLDGRPHLEKNIRQWLGDSVGHWEGNTLVVDTTNYPDKTIFNAFNPFNNCCLGAGANLHVIERFTRQDADTIDYQYRVDDPTTYTKPWTVSFPMSKSEEPLYEYACHEGNYGIANLLRGARSREKAAAEAKKQ